MSTVIAWLGFLLAIGAAGFAWKLNQELETTRRRLDRYNKALFDVNDEVRQLRATLAESNAALRVELMHRTGTPAFTSEMTVREVQLMHPQAGEVLGAFHLGGCSSCAVEPDDTLATVCAQSGVPTAQVLNNLNLLLGDFAGQAMPANGTAANGTGSNGAGNTHAAKSAQHQPFIPQPVKLPNVEFDI
ncbi:MAG: hypothetical protein WDZ49_09905 [Litorilinea sp.]